jgi:hypothetical protein
MIQVEVEVIDLGNVWGSEKIMAAVHGGQIQRLYIAPTRLSQSP